MRSRSKVGAGLHTIFTAGLAPWRWVRWALGLLAVCIAFRPTPVRAQQAIVTMPSADITDRGIAFAMKESQLRVWGPKPMSRLGRMSLSTIGTPKLAASNAAMGNPS